MLPDSLARLDSCWFLYYKVSFERFSLQFIQAPSFFEIHSLVNLIGPIYSKWVVYIQVDVDSAAQLSSFEWFLCLLDSLDFFCEHIDSIHQFEVVFLLYCVLTLSLAWCEGSSFFYYFFTGFQMLFLLCSVCTGHLWHISTVSNVMLLKWQYILDSEVEWNGYGALFF